MRSFVAKHPGSCSECGNDLQGTEVFYTADRELAHVNCPWNMTDEPVDVCPVCNCTRPCWCPEAVQAPEDAADRALRRAKENANRDPWDGF